MTNTQPMLHDSFQANVHALFAGGVTVLGEEGELSGLCKRRITEACVSLQGFKGDEIVDRRYHGGIYRAVCFLPVEHYTSLQALFPETSYPLKAGSLGENISCQGLSDQEVCIGDIYQMGSVTLQVTQPRSPCWKLNTLFQQPTLSKVIQQTRRTGWYAKIIKEGSIVEGDVMVLLERMRVACSIAQFWDATLASNPDLDKLTELSLLTGLCPEWRKRLNDRVMWWQKNKQS